MHKVFNNIVNIESGNAAPCVDINLLEQLTTHSDISYAPDLSWSDVLHLYLLDRGSVKKGNGELKPGCYVASAGKWVLLAGLKAAEIQKYADRCCTSLERIVICCADRVELHINRAYLRELCLYGNGIIHSASELGGLGRLRMLKLRGAKLDSELDLTNLQWLENLDLRSTKLIGIRLDSSLKHLRECDLSCTGISDFGFLSKCPALESLDISGNSLVSLPEGIQQIKNLRWQGTQTDMYSCDRSAEQVKTLGDGDTETVQLTPLSAAPNIPNVGGIGGIVSEAAQRNQVLMRDLANACIQLQESRIMQNVQEDDRNDVLRTAMVNMRYNLVDQTHTGYGGTGVRAGSLDLRIRHADNLPWTNLEALNLESDTEEQKQYWNEHLDKLMDNYNASGLPTLFLISYVNCAPDDYGNFFDVYSDHMKQYNPRIAKVRGESFTEVFPTGEQNAFLRVNSCAYDLGGSRVTVYHYFVGFVQGGRLDAPMEERETAVLNAIRQDPHVTITGMAQQMGISKTAAQKVIDQMKKEKKIIHEGKGKKGQWKILRYSPSVPIAEI